MKYLAPKDMISGNYYQMTHHLNGHIIKFLGATGEIVESYRNAFSHIYLISTFDRKEGFLKPLRWEVNPEWCAFNEVDIKRLKEEINNFKTDTKKQIDVYENLLRELGEMD